MAKETSYSFKTGFLKSLKNVAVVLGPAALIFLVDNWTQWIPDKYNAIALPIFGFISYFVKNYFQNK